nr:MAG TPA_asm: hypothetical protein [Caudoviricetes sp.]
MHVCVYVCAHVCVYDYTPICLYNSRVNLYMCRFCESGDYRVTRGTNRSNMFLVRGQ